MPAQTRSADGIAYIVRWDGVLRDEYGNPDHEPPPDRQPLTAREQPPAPKTEHRGRTWRPLQSNHRPSILGRALIEHMEAQPGQWFTVRQMEETSTYSFDQVRNALYTLAKQGRIQVKKVSGGGRKPHCEYSAW